MATKRERGDCKPVVKSADALRTLISSESGITSHKSGEIALLRIMEEYRLLFLNV